MPLSRAFLSLGISSELPLFCSAIPTPPRQAAVGPAPARQRGEWVRPRCGRAPWESQRRNSHLRGTSEVCVLSLRGIRRITEEKLKEGLVGCDFTN